MNTVSTPSSEIDIYADNPVVTLEYQIAVLQTYRDGARLQSRYNGPHPDEHSSGWLDQYGPTWDWSRYVYRIHPGLRPRIASGHNPTSLTEDQVGVKEGWRLLEEQEIVPRDNSGVGYGEIEAWRFRKWERRLYNAVRHTGSCSDTIYRTQHSPGYFLPKPKAKVRVPLTIEDLPSLFWMRCFMSHETLITSIDPDGNIRARFNVGQGNGYMTQESWSMTQLCEHLFEFSSDRKTWHPCWKEV